MNLIDYFLSKRKKTAVVAKERLQIILARERVDRSGPDYLPDLKRELLAVVAKYVQVDVEQVQVQLQREGDCEILELNIALPEHLPQPRQHALSN
jgi:cell division topological specificity factor